MLLQPRANATDQPLSPVTKVRRETLGKVKSQRNSPMSDKCCFFMTVREVIGGALWCQGLENSNSHCTVPCRMKCAIVVGKNHSQEMLKRWVEWGFDGRRDWVPSCREWASAEEGCSVMRRSSQGCSLRPFFFLMTHHAAFTVASTRTPSLSSYWLLSRSS